MSKEKEIQRHGNNAVNINHPKRKNAAQGCEEKYKKLGETQAWIFFFQGDKAKKEGCTIAYLLSNGELETMKKEWCTCHTRYNTILSKAWKWKTS